MNLKEFLNNIKMRRDGEREAKILRRCERDMQIQEFSGTLYITYRDRPIVPIDALKPDPIDILRAARVRLAEWRKENPDII